MTGFSGPSSSCLCSPQSEFWPAGSSHWPVAETGTRAKATVTECHVESAGTHATDGCSGSWVIGGSRLGSGHVVIGDVQGAERRDIGKTLDVTVRGDTAYTRGLGLPIVLTTGGLVGAVGLGWLTAKTLVSGGPDAKQRCTS
jgi:hypothetical protein